MGWGVFVVLFFFVFQKVLISRRIQRVSIMIRRTGSAGGLELVALQVQTSRAGRLQQRVLVIAR
jgi:hypothetical protein